MNRWALVALWFTCLTTSAAEPVAKTETVRLALPPMTALHLPPETASYFGNYLAQQITLEGVRVITSAEIAALLGAEREKAILG